MNWAPSVDRCDCSGPDAIGVPLPKPPAPSKGFATFSMTTDSSSSWEATTTLGPLITVVNVPAQLWNNKYWRAQMLPDWGETA